MFQLLSVLCQELSNCPTLEYNILGTLRHDLQEYNILGTLRHDLQEYNNLRTLRHDLQEKFFLMS